MPPLEAPNQIISYFEENGYNSRRPNRSPKFAQYVLQDLLRTNPTLRNRAEDGEVSFSLNYSFTTGGTVANLILGSQDGSDAPEESDEMEYPILNRKPDEVWLALRVTALMTQLERNVTNRRGDLQSMSQEAYSANPETVTSGLVITTISNEVRFNHHDDVQTSGLGTDAVNTVLTKLSEAISPHEGKSSSLDGLALIVLEYDGMSSPEIYQSTPAPDPDNRLNYSNFISNISDLIDQRFIGLPDPQSASITEFASQNEGRTIEFKEEIPDEPRDLAEEVVAMLNTDGGVVIFGVNDDGDIVGIDDADGTQNTAANIVRDYIEDSPEITWDQSSVEGNDVVIMRLPRDKNRLYSINGTFYTRFGESSMPMRFPELERFIINRIVDRHRLDELVN